MFCSSVLIFASSLLIRLDYLLQLRKVATCGRCKTIMYPGPTKSTTNHRRGVCADGVKSKPAAESPNLPPWPQPTGIFSDGESFHAHAFLKKVQEVYGMVTTANADGTNLLLVEAQAFLLMLSERTVILTDADSRPTTALFKIYAGFQVDGSVPADRIVQHDGAECLRVGYLEQSA